MAHPAVAYAEPWVERDETPLTSFGELALAGRFLAPASVTPLWGVEVACEQRARWPIVVRDSLSFEGSSIDAAYHTPVFLQQESEPSDVCRYLTTGPRWTTSLNASDWPGSPMSWAFVASGGTWEPSRAALRNYVVASLETAPSDVLLDVVDLLAAPDRPSPRFAASASAAL